MADLLGWLSSTTGLGKKDVDQVAQPYIPRTEDSDFYEAETHAWGVEQDSLGQFSSQGAAGIGRGAPEVKEEEEDFFKRFSSQLTSVFVLAEDDNKKADSSKTLAKTTSGGTAVETTPRSGGAAATGGVKAPLHKPGGKHHLRPVGIGLSLAYDEVDEVLVVKHITEGGSADKGGLIQVGDLVLELEGVDVTTGHPIDIIEAILLGRHGTACNMLVRRFDADNIPMDIGVALPRSRHNADSSDTVRRERCGVGITFEVDTIDASARVKALVRGGSAHKSQLIKPGDILYEIDGVKVLYGIGPNGRPLSNIEIQEMLRGPEGSVLNLRLQKGRRGRLAQVNLTRTSGPAYAATYAAPPPPPQHAPPQMQKATVDRAQAQGPPSMTGLYGTHQSGFSGDGHMAAPHYASQDALMQQQYASQEQLPMQQQQQQQPEEEQLEQQDFSYADKYLPETPDRFGLGLVFKPYGTGQMRIASIIPGGPADLCGQNIQLGDWLYEVDGVPVYKQPISRTMNILQAKRKGDVVTLGLRHSGDRHITVVQIAKGATGVKLMNCGCGIVYKQDPDAMGRGWVRVAQVVPNGPAIESIGEGVIKVNDRVLEVNGEDVARKPLREWSSLLLGREGSSCVITFADNAAELYTCNIIRGFVDQSAVDKNSVHIIPPLMEKAINRGPPQMATEKKVVANLSGVSIGVSFTEVANGEMAVDRVDPYGPASGIPALGGLGEGDVICEIGDGPSVQPQMFPRKDVLGRPFSEWATIVAGGVPETPVQAVFRRPDGSMYEVLVNRELRTSMRVEGNEPLATVGLRLAGHGDSVYVDKDGVAPGSSALKQGVREGYILVAIDNVPMAGRLNDLEGQMNEFLIGAPGSPVQVTFKTAAGNVKYNLTRDLPINLAPCQGKPPPRMEHLRILPFDASLFAPGNGVPLRPMSNPTLWSSLQEEPTGESKGMPGGDQTRFQWRGRILKQPEYAGGICNITDAITGELVYKGPGVNEGQQGASARQPSPPLPDAFRELSRTAAPPAAVPAAPAVAAPPPQAAPVQEAVQEVEAVQQAPAEAPPVDLDMDDETFISLHDGRSVEAKQLEEVLKKHLDAVAYVMVIGSGKPFLSCMLTLKTNGSEAAERGEDPKSVQNPFDLATPALALASKVNSQATNVHQARQCTLFRAHGLLPGFSTANQEIGDGAQQVRRFSILTAHFTRETGELNADGTLNRLKIKQAHKNIIEGMYQQKKPAAPAAPPA
mmetsp:Transcript_635/g.1687  ORF Transcript_635/g.1687 Transcript_635/m.1687 type:complete len:1235 (-) Transcript_635:72-3776(-)